MNESDKHPQSLLDALITDLIDEMHLDARTRVANLDDKKLKLLESVLGKFLTYRLEKLNEQVNEELLKECVERSGDKSLDDVGASGFILTELWKRLQETHL
jgi:hypothetical protein